VARRNQRHPEHVNHERWLVSYADFITLLFAFFVVLFASSQSSKNKKQQFAQAMQSAFEHTPPAAVRPSAVVEATPLLPDPSAAEQARAVEGRIRDVINSQVARRHLAESAISTHVSHEGLVISMREAGFFPSGSATIRPESLDVLNAVAAALPQQPMRVEGHTDNVPIHTELFATNWELSTARAAAITRQLIAMHAALPTQISAAGYAEFQPMADNATAEGRNQNRRVDIILLFPPKS
jgi:chemotaxis protein MotB